MIGGMNRSFRMFSVLLTVAALSGTAKAHLVQTPAPPVAAGPCGTLELFLDLSAKQSVLARYTTTAVFPTPPQRVETFKPFSIVCPRFSAVYDNKTLRLKGVTLDDALSKLLDYSLYGEAFRLVDPNVDVTSKPENQVYAIGLGLSLQCITPQQSLGRFCRTSSSDVLDNGQPLQPYIEGLDFAKDIVIGIRQDGGALQPAWFDGKLVAYTIDRLKPFEIYIRPHPAVTFEKVRIDPVKNEVIWTKKSGFPSK